MSMSLAQKVIDKALELGVEEASKFFNKPQNVVKAWLSGNNKPKIEDLDKVMEFPDPTINDKDVSIEITPEPVEKKKDLMILLPTNRDFNAYVMFSILANWNQETMRLTLRKDTILTRGRNWLAHQFLASDCEWSLWWDSDIIAPWGNPVIMKEYTGLKYGQIKSIEHLKKSGQKIIQAVYAERKHTGMLIIQPEIKPRGGDDWALCKTLREKGPQNRIVPVDFVATGFTLVHRSVYEDIKVTSPEIAPVTEGGLWGFFDTKEDVGEDVAFSRRAIKAGHQPSIDCGLFVSHVGVAAFNP